MSTDRHCKAVFLCPSRLSTCLLLSSWITLTIWHVIGRFLVHTTSMNSREFGPNMTQKLSMCLLPTVSSILNQCPSVSKYTCENECPNFALFNTGAELNIWMLWHFSVVSSLHLDLANCVLTELLARSALLCPAHVNTDQWASPFCPIKFLCLLSPFRGW